MKLVILIRSKYKYIIISASFTLVIRLVISETNTHTELRVLFEHKIYTLSLQYTQVLHYHQKLKINVPNVVKKLMNKNVIS